MVNNTRLRPADEFLLQIHRTFAASRQRVFDAWAKPEQLERWMCKDVAAHQVIHHEQDIRPGGRWRIEIRDTAKNEVYWGEGIYREVKPPEKIVFTWSWFKEVPGAANEDMHSGSTITVVTVEFFERGDQTEVVLTQQGLGSEKLRTEHEQGWTGCLNLMERTL